MYPIPKLLFDSLLDLLNDEIKAQLEKIWSLEVKRHFIENRLTDPSISFYEQPTLLTHFLKEKTLCLIPSYLIIHCPDFQRDQIALLRTNSIERNAGMGWDMTDLILLGVHFKDEFVIEGIRERQVDQFLRSNPEYWESYQIILKKESLMLSPEEYYPILVFVKGYMLYDSTPKYLRVIDKHEEDLLFKDLKQFFEACPILPPLHICQRSIKYLTPTTQALVYEISDY